MEEPIQKVVRAEAFELVDASGRTRATLAAEENGACWLSFGGRDGERRARFGVSESDCPSVELLDGQEQVGAGLRVTGTGPQLRLCGSDGRAEVKLEITGILGSDMVVFTCARAEGGSRVLTVLTDGNTALEATANDEQPAARVAVGSDGELEIGVIAPGGKPWAGLQMSAEGTPGVTLRDRPGGLRAVLALGPGDAPQFTFTDAGGSARMVLILADAARPRLFFMDEKDRRLAALGIDSEDDPWLALETKDGRPGVSLGFKRDGRPCMLLFGDDGGPRIELLASGTRGSSGISLCAPGASPRLALIVDEEGRPEAVIIDGKERRRLEIGLLSHSMPWIQLFDGARKEYRAALGLAEDGRPVVIIGGSRWRKKRVLMAP